MNEIQALKLKLSRSKNIFDVIECCKEWRTILFRHLRFKFRSYQEPLSDKIIEMKLAEGALGNEIITLMARQSGKTETVALTVLILGTFYVAFLNEEFTCGLFAPVKSMITHVTRNRLRTRYSKAAKWLKKELGLKQIAGEGLTSSIFVLKSLITEKEMYVQSLSVGERAEIIGPTFGLMIIEQSELVNALKLKNDVFPMGAEKGGIRVLTGTTSPYFKNEYFRQAIDQYNIDPEKNRSTADYIEIVDWKEAATKSVAYRRYVTKERDRLKEDSIEFRTQYCLEWVGVKLKFIGWEELALLEQDYTWCKERLRFFGIDIAKAGDSTVVTIIELDGTDKHIIAWLELEGIDYENQIPRIVEFLREYAPLRFGLIDVVAVGEAVYDMLKRRLWDRDEKTGKPIAWARLDGYYGSAPDNHERNQAMDREFQHGRVHYPKHTRYKYEKNKFIEQMLDLERKYTQQYLKLEHPDIKGRHDDYPISLSLAIWALIEKAFKGGVTGVRF